MADVSGQPVGPIFRGQESKKRILLGFLTTEDVTDNLFRNVGKKLRATR